MTIQNNQQDINHLSSSITFNEIEAAKEYPKIKVQDLMDSQMNATRPSKKS
jgi:hypothetical protein